MLCKECPYHLACHVGSLDSDEHGRMSLCPSCKKLTLVPPQSASELDTPDPETGLLPQPMIMLVQFKCEQREINRNTSREFAKIKRGALNKTGIAQLNMIDTGPATDRPLLVKECMVCTQVASRMGCVVRDLDEEAEIAKELGSSPFELRGKE